uniref:WSC domain-containing protein n=1 Tax=Macrostomum lignano TaxID=282301 RepID=A0A1I8JG20_9PLAT
QSSIGCAVCCLLLLQPVVCRSYVYHYIGCYVDNPDKARDLTGLRGILKLGSLDVGAKHGVIRSHHMTAEFCSNACSLGGFAYFGLQYSSECFCGASYGSYGAASSGCDMLCSGSSKQYCGGALRNSVFAIQYQVAKGLPETSTINFRPSRQTYWTANVNNVIQCSFSCNSSCQAFIYSQLKSVCYLLSFALVPREIGTIDGVFLIRK